MQGQQSPTSLASLIHKIRGLRRRLLSYGWNRHESTQFILYQFLKLPQPQWNELSTTVSFYQIKEKYKIETKHAEIIFSLQQIVPNLQNNEVLEYLHSVFQYSALEMGFEILDSSSDSGENPHIIKKSHAHHYNKVRPYRHRPTFRESPANNKKKVHREQECGWNVEKVKQEVKEEARLVKEEARMMKEEVRLVKEEVRLVRKRKMPSWQPGQMLCKQVKREQSE